jgi:hypothetical protein
MVAILIEYCCLIKESLNNELAWIGDGLEEGD